LGRCSSVKALHSNAIDSITDIHDRNTYVGWSDLVYTVQSIVLNEATGSSNVWVNVPNPMTDPGNGRSSPTENHSDHIYSGQLMLDAIIDMPCINRASFYGYQTGHRDSHLNEDQTIIAAATWGATIAGRAKHGWCAQHLRPGAQSMGRETLFRCGHR